MAEGDLTEIFRTSTTRVKSIAFHPVFPVFLAGHHCGAISLWSTDYCQRIRTLTEHSGSVRCVAFHPSGELFATGGDDCIVRVWSYRTCEVQHRLKGHGDYVRSVVFHPTHPWVLSASDDCTVRIWNYYNGESVATSSGHQHYVMSAAFLDSTHFVTASLDHTMGLWSCAPLFERSRKLMQPSAVLAQSIEAHSNGINTLCVSPDGKLYSGADDREVKAWRYSDGSLLFEGTLCAQTGNVTSVCVADGVVFSVSEDGTIIVVTGSAAGRTQRVAVGPRLWAVAAKNGRVVVGSDDGLIVYRHGSVPLASRFADRVWFVQGSLLRQATTSDWKAVNVLPLPRCASRLVALSEKILIIEYADKNCEIVTSDGARRASDLMAVSDRRVYAMRGSSLIRATLKDAALTFSAELADEEVVAEGLPRGVIVASEKGVFHASGHTLRYYADSSTEEKESEVDGVAGCNTSSEQLEAETGSDATEAVLDSTASMLKNKRKNRRGRARADSCNKDKTTSVGRNKSWQREGDAEPDHDSIYNCGFEICQVLPGKNCIAVVGRNKIAILTSGLKKLETFEEYATIVSAGFIEVPLKNNTKASSDDGTDKVRESVLVYSTERQVKYYFYGSGVLRSLDKDVVVVGAEEGVLVVISERGIERLPVSFGELEFRRAVCLSGDVDRVLKKEKLPGLAPLEFLVKSGHSAVALPYVRDTQGRFDILIGCKEFEKAYELCENTQMYKRLGDCAAQACDVEVAEKCYSRISDHQSLFFLFLSSGRVDALAGLSGTSAALAAGIILENAAMCGLRLPEEKRIGHGVQGLQIGQHGNDVGEGRSA